MVMVSWSCTYVVCSVAQQCLTRCDPMDCSPPGSSVHGDSPGKNTGVGCHALLQGIFSAQGSNPGLPHCRWILYHLSHQGSPVISLYICYKASNDGLNKGSLLYVSYFSRKLLPINTTTLKIKCQMTCVQSYCE